MIPVNKSYRKKIAKDSGYRATWEPTIPLFMGAVGKLDSTGVFNIYTTLEKEGILPELYEVANKGSMNYTSSETVQVQSKLAGSIPPTGSILSTADAGFVLDFKSSEGIVFMIKGYRTQQYINLKDVESAILSKYRSGTWQKDMQVITQLVIADRSTIIISNTGSNRLEIKAHAGKTKTPLALTSADLDLQVVKETGSSMRIVAESHLTPLYKIMGIQHPFFGEAHLSTKSTVGNEELVLNHQPFLPEETEL